MMDKVSIIIPVYNSEKYLEDCIKSVINQTYNNIEIILINDGSEDNSLSICEKYSKLDNRIKLINNKKSGVSSARNSGLSISTGKYVMFLDSDDYFSDDYVERMYKTIEKTKSDIVISGFRCFENNKEEIIQYSNEDKYLELDSIINDMVNTYYFNSISKTITKLDIIKNNNIEFDISLTYFEDYKFSFMVMKKCKKIFYISNCFYNYRINEDSSTRKLSFEKVFKWFNDNNSVIDYIYSNDNSLKNIENVKLINLTATLCILGKIDKMKYKDFKNYSNKIINKFYTLVSKNKINIRLMKQETKFNKIRMWFILHNCLFLLYISAKLSKIIKK